MKDRRIARGIYQTPYGWRLLASVRGQSKWKRVKDRDHEFDLAKLKDLRAAWNAEARQPRTAGPGASFAQEARLDYFPAIAAMPWLEERKRHIELWIAAIEALLGAGVQRSAIQPKHIKTVRDRWLTIGPKTVQRAGGRVELALPLSAQTVRLRMRALENLWTILDGKHAPNPVRQVAEPTGPTAQPKGLSYGVVNTILATMPARRHAYKLTRKQVAQIRAALARPHPNRSALARKHGVSEALIRKIERLGDRYRVDQPAIATLFATAIAATGFSHGEINGLTPDALHLDADPPWVWVAGRKKGRGTTGVPQSLTADGAAAIRALADAGIFTRERPPSASSIRQAVHRACAKADVPLVTPYVFRHSYATAVLRTTGSVDATQLAMRHQDRRTSLHYAGAAVDPARAALTRQLEAAGAFRGDLPPGKVSRENEADRGKSRQVRNASTKGKLSRK